MHPQSSIWANAAALTAALHTAVPNLQHPATPCNILLLAPEQALTKAGFKSSMRNMSNSSSGLAATMQAKREAKMAKMREATINLVVAWVS